MLKLVGDEVASVEQFMSRYKVCAKWVLRRKTVTDGHRWTTLRHYIEYKLVCPRL